MFWCLLLMLCGVWFDGVRAHRWRLNSYMKSIMVKKKKSTIFIFIYDAKQNRVYATYILYEVLSHHRAQNCFHLNSYLHFKLELKHGHFFLSHSYFFFLNFFFLTFRQFDMFTRFVLSYFLFYFFSLMELVFCIFILAWCHVISIDNTIKNMAGQIDFVD